MTEARQAGKSPSFKIPNVGELSVSQAALAYADAGFFVLPVARGKHPGSIVGKGWPDKSSTDSEQIELWWDDNPSAGIAIHAGPSGLTFFDLDVDTIPDELAWLRTGIIQFSRHDSERGHYGFFTGDEIFRSGGLKLTDGTKIGEIRSGNTVVIAAPSEHVKVSDGGQYRWRTKDVDSPIPKLPSEARKYLNLLGTRKLGNGTEHTAMAGWAVEAADETVKNATSEWQSETRPKSLAGLASSVKNVGSGTRDQTRDAMRVAACESRIGFYPLADAIDQIRTAMIASYHERGEPDKFNNGEFHRLVKNGVGYALTRDTEEISAEAHRNYGSHHTQSDFEESVAVELRKLEIRAEARQRFDSSRRPPFARSATSLTSFLAQQPNPTPMRIDTLMPDGGRVVFSAPYKAGKTTAVGNLIRSLVDGDPFLETFAVNKPAKRLVLIDNEMSQDMVRDWLLKQGIRNTDAVADVICLRGQVSSFDILNDQRRAEWATWLRDLGCDYLIFDCLRPVLDALGLDENHDAGKFLTAFDELLAEAQTSGDTTIVHHMGHQNERSRGDSRIQDWPDTIWKVVRENADDEFSPRYFSATGRDVEVQQGLLTYNPANHHLTYQDKNRAEARKQRKVDTTVQEILTLLANDATNGGNGIKKGDLLNAVTAGRPAAEKALELGIVEGSLSAEKGPNNSTIYRIRAGFGSLS